MIGATALIGLLAGHVLSNPIVKEDLTRRQTCTDRVIDTNPSDGAPGDGFNCQLCLEGDFKFSDTTPDMSLEVVGPLLDIPAATDESSLIFYPDGVGAILDDSAEDPADPIVETRVGPGRDELGKRRKLPGPSGIWRSSNYRKAYDKCVGCWIFINPQGTLEYVLDTGGAVGNRAQVDHLFEGQQIGGFLLWADEQGLLGAVGGVQGAWNVLTKCKAAFQEIKNIINNPVNFWGFKTSANNIKGDLLGGLNPFKPSVDTAIFMGVRDYMNVIRNPYMETAGKIGTAIEQILKIPGIGAKFRTWAEAELDRVLRELWDEIQKRLRRMTEKQIAEDKARRATILKLSTFNPRPSQRPIKGNLFDFGICDGSSWDGLVNS
ncbi:MAG: hypothetical protein Q9215_005212 [Flavoplaca cf. flavocitrina]